MLISELFAIGVYLSILAIIGIVSHRRHVNAEQFILGGRSMNFWLTALAAHASDMSSWIFMGYPAVLFMTGLCNVWVAVGLTLCMGCNWQFIAPKIRIATEETNTYTFSSFFEARFQDSSGIIRLSSTLLLFLFYTVYISAGLIGLGILISSLFPISYYGAVMFGVLMIVPYLLIGGYITLAWTDLFQGLFLLATILFVPTYLFVSGEGIALLEKGRDLAAEKFSLLPPVANMSFLQSGLYILFSLAGWGLGYFGQPHIITKFMGIKDVQEIHKAKYVGMSWQIIALSCATLIGLLSIGYFPGGIDDPEKVFIQMVTKLFSPLLSTFILCAIIGATITVVDSQILVLASSLSEDLYKPWINPKASSKELLKASRISILFIALCGYGVALLRPGSIFSLVSYAWFGLGASFGPLLFYSLYAKRLHRYGAYAGILVGGCTAALWPLCPLDIPTLIPGFFFSSLAIFCTCRYMTKSS